jgi:hypothetical protein
MLFNVTFNIISAISWWPVLLVEETDLKLLLQPNIFQGRRGRDCMVVWFTTTYAISTYHH